ncbi:MAG: alpha/beta hydrolase [Candidatus Moranbacteria bacterium]|nr:alpha/beta hydrolase [Candidatus Moranbacteria bacterium]
MKRIFIVHGWAGYPEEGWFPWLKKELETRGFIVVVPQLPDPENPRIEGWVAQLAETVGVPDKDCFFVGHSIGCPTIAHYLESLPDGVTVGGAVFVAGFFRKLTNLEGDAATQETAKLWLEAPLDLEKVKSHLAKSVAIFSDNDPYVPLDNQDDFCDKLGSEIIVEHKQGHFSGSTGTTALPIALESVLKIVA